MIDIECPFCEEPCRLEVAVFAAPTSSFRCAGCAVELEIAAAPITGALATAA
jgi:hypothetical protein